jgi:hypothetical protein
VYPLQKSLCKFLKNLKTDLPYDPAIPFLGIYLKECKSIYKRGICALMFIAALFTTAKLWNQQRCPTNNEWIKKILYIYVYIYIIYEYYIAINKNEIVSFADKWMELENITLIKVSQAQKAKYCLICFICGT